jgi:hypothetical protein
MSLFNFELDQTAKLFEELKRSNGRSKDNQATLLLLLDKIFIVLYSLQFQIDEGKTVAQGQVGGSQSARNEADYDK